MNANKVRILGIDPGPEKSAGVVLNDKTITDYFYLENKEFRSRLIALVDAGTVLQLVAVEDVKSRGMPVGDSVFVMVRWIGRFIECSVRAKCKYTLITNAAVRSYICGSMKAKDTNIARSLMDIIGEKGTKKNPGPTYGLSQKTHTWSALAVAVTARDTLRIKPYGK